MSKPMEQTMNPDSLDAVWLWLERVVAWAILAATRTTLQRRPRLDMPGAAPASCADPERHRRICSDEHALSNHIVLALDHPDVGTCDRCPKRIVHGKHLSRLCYACERAAKAAQGKEQRP